MLLLVSLSTRKNQSPCLLVYSLTCQLVKGMIYTNTAFGTINKSFRCVIYTCLKNDLPKVNQLTKLNVRMLAFFFFFEYFCMQPLLFNKTIHYEER